MRIHISAWILVGAVVTAVAVAVLASQGWIDVKVFKEVFNLLTE